MAEALDLLCKQIGCDSHETAVVGDRFNDEAIMVIGYPCRDKIVSDASQVKVSEDDLKIILPHMLVT